VKRRTVGFLPDARHFLESESRFNRAFCHPPQRDFGGFGINVAPANIRVTSGEPCFLDDLLIRSFTRLRFVAPWRKGDSA